MSWKFWRKEPQFEMQVTDVPTSTLFRWYLYDIKAETPNKFAEALGFTPISAEGEEFERKESDLRLERVLPYMDFIELIANINGEVLAETLTSALKKFGVFPDDTDVAADKDLMSQLYTQISASALIPFVAAALQLGILVNPGSFVSGEINE